MYNTEIIQNTSFVYILLHTKIIQIKILYDIE